MSRSQPSWRRTYGRVLFGLGFAALLLLLTEGILGLGGVRPILYEEDPYVGFSSRVPLFVEEAREDGSRWMVTARNKLRAFNPQEFPVEKAAGAVRIFCMGGSTTYGRPYQDSTSFCGWLRELLREAEPTRRWEVINAGGVSYASYRVSALMEELSAYDPDIFVIYTGQNEFLERRTYGRLLETPAVLRAVGAVASGTRIYAALRAAIGGRHRRSEDGDQAQLTDQVQALLGDAVGPSDYHRDDAHRDRVLAHYQLNLERMVGIARAAGARPLLVVPASNLAACSPFKSTPTEALSLDQVAAVDARLVRARQALATGDAPAALAEADRALAIDDRRADAHYTRGQALRALGRADDARRALERARDEDVCPLRALGAARALLLQVADQYDVPLVDFESIVAAHSPRGIAGREMFLDHVHPTIDGHRLLAMSILEALAAAGDLPRSVVPTPEQEATVVERVTESLDRRAHGAALRNLAKVLRWAGKIEDADRLAAQATALVPDDPEVYYSRGQTARAQGRLAEAETFYRQAVQLAPGLVAGHMELAMTLHDQGRGDEAMRSIRTALALDPTNPQALNNLGVVWMGLGRFDEAVAAYERCLEQDPRYLKALNNLGQVYLEQQRLDEAIVALKRALAVDPNYVISLYNLALAHGRGGDRPRARAAFQRILQIDPRHVDARYGLCALAAQEGRYDAALDQCQQALRLDPDHANTNRLLPAIRAELK